MSDDKPRQAWGAGRVALVARLDTIRSEMGQGLPLTAIYDRHRATLGIGYQSFCKLIARYAGDAKLSPRYAAPRSEAPRRLPAPKPVPPAPAVAPQPPSAEGSVHVRHGPARATFQHHGIVQAGEPEQLFGPGFLPKRRG